ncbi:MAG: hypothetical protein EWV58_05300 [Microcystis aeruginosa Ma_MB_F_20061100_S19]|nr:MAG: hypothetical protein EWV59_04010 [Microcystis aeruginosa Ma_MB_F_20061100_S19D]TRU17283.1 MAG: hypothetical protein EWV58_05300 [Microcystis aeruginosa Ma_MB_F_20061100_S19]
MYNAVLESSEKRKDSHYKKSITEAAAQVKGSLLFFQKFSKKKIKEAAGDIRFFFTFWAKKNLLGCL